MSKKRITLVVAMDEAGGIGKNGKLPWNIPEELAHFKRVTSGPGKTIIMGRKTFDSIKRALPDRRNIVLTRSGEVPYFDQIIVAQWIEQALELSTDDVYVIGGGEVYKQFLPLAHRVIMSIIPGTYDCDTFFPELPRTDWEPLAPVPHDRYQTVEWVRISSKSRGAKLVIDYLEIKAKSDKRVETLKALEEIIRDKLYVTLSELQSAYNMFEALTHYWNTLDAEGRGLLPAEIQSIMPMFPSWSGWLKVIIGWDGREDQKKQLGFRHLAEYSQVPEKPTPHLDEIVRVCEGPSMRRNRNAFLSEDNTCLDEGWDMFDVDGRWQLQRIDYPSDHQPMLNYTEPKFASDADALMWVAKQAWDSDYHYSALTMIGTLVEGGMVPIKGEQDDEPLNLGLPPDVQKELRLRWKPGHENDSSGPEGSWICSSPLHLFTAEGLTPKSALEEWARQYHKN